MEWLRADGARDALVAFLLVLLGGSALIQVAHHFLGLPTAEGNAAFEALPLVAILIAHHWLVRDESPDDN